VEDGDRRMAVFICSEDYSSKSVAGGTSARFGSALERKEYFARLWADVADDAAVRAFHDHLTSVDLSDFDPEEIPETSIRKELMSYSACPAAKWIADWYSGEPMRLNNLVNGPSGVQIVETCEIEWTPGRHFPCSELFEMFKDYCQRNNVDKANVVEKDALAYTLRGQDFKEYLQAQARNNRRGWVLTKPRL